MKTTQKIIINKPIVDVWKVLAEDFDKASQWMALVPVSRVMHKDTKAAGAPMTGRVCDTTHNTSDPSFNEEITRFDTSSYQLDFIATPNGGKMPIVQNKVAVSLIEKDPHHTKVIWSCDTTLKPIGKLLYPLMRMGFNKTFKEVLEELKFFIENGKPHPRKIAKMKQG